MFHLIGALEEIEKLGTFCVGRSPDDEERLYAETVAVLDRESTRMRPPSIVESHLEFTLATGAVRD